MIRILLACVLASDLLEVLQLDLVVPLFGALDIGAIGDPIHRKQVPLLYQYFPPSAATAWAAFSTLLAATVLFGLGVCTRVAALVLLLASSQLAQVMPPADRGIDMLIRNAVLILMFSGCHRTWSVDARIRTGKWTGDGAAVPAWPRHLLILQVMVVYFSAGMQKFALSWTPLGDYSALYIVLRDPAFARFDAATLDSIYPLTQLATAVSWAWEWCTPLALFALWSRATRTRPGRLRAWMNRTGFFRVWVFVGMTFHLGIAFSMRLGIFPWAMLALYPAFFHPDELRPTRWRAGRKRSVPGVASTGPPRT